MAADPKLYLSTRALLVIRSSIVSCGARKLCCVTFLQVSSVTIIYLIVQRMIMTDKAMHCMDKERESVSRGQEVLWLMRLQNRLPSWGSN